MKPYFEGPGVTLYHGDCIEVMRTLPDESAHAVVTDPPYGLEFMGKAWDSFKPKDIGRGVRVAELRAEEMTAAGKGHATSAGPYLAARVDSIRSAGLPFQRWCEEWARECMRVLKPGGHLLAFGGSRTWHRLASGVEDAGFEMRDSIAWLYGSGFPKSHNLDGDWQGWGTALKPAFEPIVVARKPLIGTVAVNVLTHGTGALNVDASRVRFTSEQDKQSAKPQGAATALNGALAGKAQQWRSDTTQTARSTTAETTDSSATSRAVSAGSAAGTGRAEFTPKQSDLGRWPSNVLLDGSQADALDKQSGVQRDGVAVKRNRPEEGRAHYKASSYMITDSSREDQGFGGQGGASRYFPTFRYEAKAPTSERPTDGLTAHPTVKPLDLMRWLVRLVTPSNGIVLEPFAGSGTTLEAAALEGFEVIGIEREPDYLPLIMNRLSKPMQQSLFGDWEESA